MLTQKNKIVSGGLNRVGEILFLKNLNIKNCILFIFLFAVFVILIIGRHGINITSYLFEHRSSISTILIIIVACLAIIKSYEIFRQKGTSAIFTSDSRLFGPVGDIFTQAVSILSAAYTGFIVISLIVLEKFPEEVPIEGLYLICLLMLFLLGWSGFHIYRLIAETLLFIPESVPAIKTEAIFKCSELTSMQIKELYLSKLKTKDDSWYSENCIGEDGNRPERAINGRLGGTPFYTKDGKIMRSGKTTWNQLEIKQCV